MLQGNDLGKRLDRAATETHDQKFKPNKEALLIYLPFSCQISYRISYLMDDVRSRLSSSGEGVLDLVGFTALYKRTVDYTSGMSGAIRSFGESSSPSTTIQFPEDSDEHSFHKKPIKEFSRVYTFLSTLLFCAVLIAENIVHFKLFKGYKAAVSLYWMQSCIIALLFRFWGRRRTGR